MKSRFLIVLMAAATLLSCSLQKKNTLAYFKDLQQVPNGVLANTQGDYPVRIQPDDELVISITSAVPEATAVYNLPMDNPATRGTLRTTTQPRSQTYIVNRDGYIMLPQLGRYLAKGKTLDEIAAEITSMVERDVKDPYVRVDLVNFTVDVLGEVRAPQRVSSGQEHFSVLDALAQCGDLTEFGRRDRVYVIRTEEGKREYHCLDLSDSKVFTSPYFYLKQHDVIYVEPNQIRIDNSKYNQNNAFKLSAISTVVSTISVIVSLVIALTR